jgi:hypothetical protein
MGEPDLQLFVIKPDGERVTIQVPSNAPIVELKRQVEAKTGVAPEGQDLFVRGQPPGDDSAPLTECQIGDGAEIQLFPELQVRFIDYAGRTQTVRIKGSATVPDLKNRMYAKTGVRPEDLKLMVGAKLLPHDDWTLTRCGIVNESTIHILPKRGGGLGDLR